MATPGFQTNSMYRFLRYMPDVTAPTDTNTVSLVIYLRDIPAISLLGLTNRLNNIIRQAGGGTITPGALDYLNDGRVLNIYGNRDGLALMNEFDATISFGRDRAAGSDMDEIEQMFTEAFGPETVRGMTARDMATLAIRWSQAFFILRTRFLEYAILDDIHLYKSVGERYRSEDRTRMANDYAHQPCLEEDIGWVNTQHISPRDPSSRDTRLLTCTFFESVYRLTWTEAVAIVGIAVQRNPNGTRTHYGRMFSWIVYFINRYLHWRITVTWAYSRLPFGPGTSREAVRAGIWEQNGGRDMDITYETFINRVIMIARFVLAGQPVPGNLLAQFNTYRTNLYTLARDGPTAERVREYLDERPSIVRRDLEFANETEMDWASASFNYDIAGPLPQVREIPTRPDLRGSIRPNHLVNSRWTPRPIFMLDPPQLPDTGPGKVPVLGSVAEISDSWDDDLSFSDLSSSDCSNVGQEPRHVYEIEKGDVDNQSLSESDYESDDSDNSETPLTRLTISALLRDALSRAESLKRPERTPLREVLSGRVTKGRITRRR
ncbi:hypothetical protein F4811DRAFT_536063 [Daldinia bambusicola]|nr:hypothetical protein F4811DRAFT_536063 [Daldinia bambusicola]